MRKRGLTQSSSNGPDALPLVTDRDHTDCLVASHHDEGGALAVCGVGDGGELGSVGGDVSGVNMQQVLQERVLGRHRDDLVDLGVLRLAVEA